MSNYKKTLADVQPGGRVRLGDGLPPLPKAGYVTGGDFGHEAHNAFTPEQMREYALAALSAQPSPGGQGDARAIIEEFIQCATLGRPHGKLIAQAKDYLAARQPVGEITDTEIDARLNALYREMVDSGQHNGGMSGVAWDRAVYRMASGSPAQAVDLGKIWQQAFNDTAHSYRRNKSRMWVLKILKERVQALIDSQAVGNG